jgi:hypothetical protein
VAGGRWSGKKNERRSACSSKLLADEQTSFGKDVA